jgi:hypothetical protein
MGFSFRIDCISVALCLAEETPLRWKPMLTDWAQRNSMLMANWQGKWDYNSITVSSIHHSLSIIYRAKSAGIFVANSPDAEAEGGCEDELREQHLGQ